MRTYSVLKVVGFLFQKVAARGGMAPSIISLFLFGMSLAISETAEAQSYRLEGSYYIRENLTFTGKKSIVGSLQTGSTFRVVAKTPMRDGAEGLEIEVTSMTPGSNLNPSKTGRYFIYKADSKEFVQLNANVAPLMKESDVEAGVNNCDTCGASAQTDRRQQISNRSQLADIAKSVTIVENKAPVIKVEKIERPTQLVGPVATGSLDEKIKNYSNSKEVSRMIEWATKNNSKYKSGAGGCYLKVKEALATQCANPPKGRKCTNVFSPEGGKLGPGKNLTTGLERSLKDYYARSAKERLKEKGFINLLEIEPYKSSMTTPSSAPKGAVLVYSSGIPCNVKRDGKVIASTNDCGHVEIKTGRQGEKGYVSDYYSDDGINETPRARKYGSNYKLIGVMIKP